VYETKRLIVDALSSLLHRKPALLKKCVNFVQREIDLQKLVPGTHYGTRSGKAGTFSGGGSKTQAGGASGPSGSGAGTRTEVSGMLTRNARRSSAGFDEDSASVGGTATRSAAVKSGVADSSAIAAEMQNAEVRWFVNYDDK
jgi:hypothetical protein